ncbi:Ferrienterobactin-binding periplasmic protein [Corynebacterium provencense]|uniref:Ferrienterobactin-binding periplasmic protein n=1 Tax=Corynebacterium provencense TaxID=1737425 RepID=A0A2Z3YZB9_9CORY|nr:Fe2+-enterobactin ABC transporter substrate-binding protein [Corynebacterium provencense]AWT27437.1 Ferrienterobactin-binding periplasmic protein [Corynebacterium provencense]
MSTTRTRTSLRGVKVALGVAVSAVVALSAAACSDGSSDSASDGSDSAASSNADQSWPRTIDTDDGELTLDAQPKTIVSTSTTLTGSLLAVNAPVVASAATVPNSPDLSDDQGFFNQWSQPAKDAGVEKLYENAAPDVSKAADYDPDLIVVAKNSGDSVMDDVDKLRKIAPVLVIDYSGSSWEDVTRKIGEATGHEEDAEETIQKYEDHLAEVKKDIQVPDGDTSAFIVFGDGSGAAALTDQASQVDVLKSLGFTMAAIPDSMKGDTSMGADRKDIIQLSLENVQNGLTGKNWIVVSADDKAKDMIKNDKAFNTAPAVKEGRVAYTPGETFRLDYYSATMLVDSLHDSFKK